MKEKKDDLVVVNHRIHKTQKKFLKHFSKEKKMGDAEALRFIINDFIKRYV